MDDKQSHSELVRKILTGARWATVLRLSAQVFSWLSTIIVVRFISPEDYGLNAMLESPLVLLMLFSTLGLEAALVQAKKLDTDQLRSIFGWLLVLNGMLFLSFFFGGVILALYFSEPRLEPLAKALAFLFLFVPFRVIPNALLDRDLDFKFRAQLEITTTVIAAIFTLVLAYLGAGIWALVSGVIVSKLLLAVLLMIFKPWFVIPKLELSSVTWVMSAGGILTLGNLFILLSGMLATLIAGPKLGATLLGIYAVAAQLAMLPLSRGMPVINQTMLPAFAKFQAHRDSATYYIERLLGVISLAFVPMMVGLASISDTLVLTVFGEKWAPSILPLIIMSLGMVLRMNTTLIRSAMSGMGRPDLILKSSALQLGLLLPMTIYAMDYGVIGLVVAGVMTEFLVALATVRWSQLVFDTTVVRLLRAYRPALVSAILMGLSVVACKLVLAEQNALIVLLAQILTGVISYFFAVRFIYPEEFKIAFKTVFGNRFQFVVSGAL